MPPDMTLNEKQIEETMKEANIPGVSIAFVNSKGKISNKKLGFTDKNSTTLVSAETVFGAASLSKPVFAYLVLKLAKEGVIDLKEPLDKFLSFENFCKENDFKWEKTDQDLKRAQSISAKMVLSHTTGLDLPQLDFQFEPGEGFRYSGLPFFYLQKVLEKKTGKTLEELAQKYVFGPKALDMPHSNFYRKYDLGLLSDPTRNAGKLYLNETKKGLQYEVIGLDGELKNHIIPWNKLPKDFPRSPSALIESKEKEKFLSKLLDETANAGHTTRGSAVSPNSLFTTAEDYARFINGWMNDKDKTMQKAFKPLISMTKDEWAKEVRVPIKDLEKLGCGLGWEVEINDKNEVIRAYKTGDMNQWRGQVAINFENKTAIVYFANSENGHILADQIITPNAKLKHGHPYFSQKYGFAIKLEPKWQEKEKARFNEIDEYLESRNSAGASRYRMAMSAFGESSHTAKMLAEQRTTTAKLLGDPIMRKSSLTSHKPLPTPAKREDVQKIKGKSFFKKAVALIKPTSKPAHQTPKPSALSTRLTRDRSKK